MMLKHLSDVFPDNYMIENACHTIIKQLWKIMCPDIHFMGKIIYNKCKIWGFPK